MAAFNADPPSPLKSYSPFPATVWMFPVEATTSRMTALPTSAMNRFPEAFYVHRAWEIQCRAHRGSTVTAVPKCVIPGDRLYVASGSHYFPDAGLPRIREENVPRGIGDYASRIVQLRSSSEAAVAGVTRCAHACDGGNDSSRCSHFPDYVVIGIGQKQVPRAVQTKPLRKTKLGGCGLVPVPAPG